MFEIVTPERPWYYWFKENDREVVRTVIRDGSGQLWVWADSSPRHLDDYPHKALDMVEPRDK